ncbi:extracellular solute-binding protein [Rhodococcus sp. NPDC057014]|uniref:extracellular solute-binding protein n=1 Tax=Rhodococcus sp. NPDC057014 TaxID=3346000 RepID=UPI00363CCAC8
MKSASHALTTTVAACLVLAGCAQSSATDEDAGADATGKITFVSTGGKFQEAQIQAWQVPYTNETGIGFVNDGPVDESKMKAMVDGGKVTWDVLDTSAGAAGQYCGQYLEPLDFTIVDRTKFDPETVGDCGVPAYFYSTLLMYDTSKFGTNPPTTVADFFDLDKYPGKRIVPPELSVGLLEFALLGDGVPPDQLYPLDVDRALRKLDTIKSKTIFSTTYGQIQQAMVDQQVTMALTSTARAEAVLRSGAPFTAVWDKTVVNWDDLVIPKGSPNKDAAMRFIATATDDQPSSDFSRLSSTLPVNKDIATQFDNVQEAINPFAEDRKDGVVYGDAKWWSENLDSVTDKFTNWLVG